MAELSACEREVLCQLGEGRSHRDVPAASGWPNTRSPIMSRRSSARPAPAAWPGWSPRLTHKAGAAVRGCCDAADRFRPGFAMTRIFRESTFMNRNLKLLLIVAPLLAAYPVAAWVVGGQVESAIDQQYQLLAETRR